MISHVSGSFPRQLDHDRTASLAISELTVNEHVKRVYRHFGVHSQSQLVSRFLRGDGGDVP